MLNTAILSDLHFGDPYNLVHDQGVPALLDVIKAHAGGHLRRLVLAGDIFEMSTPESMDLVHRQSRFFMQQARSRFQIDQVIWVPGNHDYTLFRSYFPSITGTSWHGDPAPQALIDDCFGPGWQVPVRVAYPHLHLCERQGPGAGQLTGRSWIIHHGHYLDDLVLGRTQNDRTVAWFSALGGGSLVSPPQIHLDQPMTLGQIETTVRPLLEAIWRHHPDPRNLQNEVWDLVRRYSDYMTCLHSAADLVIVNDESGIFTDDDMQKAYFYVRAARRDPVYPRLPAGKEHITLIFGHSHLGGVRGGVVDGVPVQVVNLGGWVASERPTEHGKEAHTHIYLINDDLQECLLHAPFPPGWAQACVDHGRTVFAIPGPDDDFVAQVESAPPAPGIPVDQLLALMQQHPFGDTVQKTDPLI